MAKPKEKKLIIVVPADLHRRLKVLSAETDQSMKTIVINALTTVLEPPSAELEKSLSASLKKSKAKKKMINTLTTVVEPSSTAQKKSKTKKEKS